MFRRRPTREVVPEVIPPGNVGPRAEPEERHASKEGEIALAERGAERIVRTEIVERPASDEEKSPPDPSAAEVGSTEAARDVVASEQESPEDQDSSSEVLAQPAAALEPAREHADASAADHPPAPTELTCEIALWRGYRKAAFYARTYYDGEEVAIAESQMFRTGGNGIPDQTEQAEEAYKAICDHLESKGWKRLSRGDMWFADKFRRELTVAEAPGPE